MTSFTPLNRCLIFGINFLLAARLLAKFSSDSKADRLVGKIMQETDEKDDALDLMAIAALRDLMVPELKQYVDMSKENEMQPFHRIMEERERSRPEGIKVFKKT